MSPRLDWPTLELRAIPLQLDDDPPALVRPYVVAHEWRQQRHTSRPRVKVICAPHGMVVVR
ncbi:hypothetical protein HUT19_27705 [Streptomyces sp. NA02950]|uniref:hypothetical protein n=1 Tax=Streptomyces sp. NA02950 TaxID=2742137 RepID=UPI00159135C4|nr:hypothetical protein [Streptomyces sp. NA02950]QKV95063.1 hypothetical protein HUT19_27705 [Streptomyces sp. NA02950]